MHHLTAAEARGSRSWLSHTGRGIALLTVGWFLVISSSPAHAQDSLPAGLVSFGHELAGRLNRGEDMTALLISQDVTCPEYFPDRRMTPIPICDGVADGTVVQGCLFGRLGSDAGPADCARLGSLLAQVRWEEFAGRTVELFTASPDGRTVGGLSCPECATLVYSTTVDATSTATKAPHILELQATVVNGAWRIYSMAVGDSFGEGGSAVVNGGIFGGRTYVPVFDPAAPSVGTGLQPRVTGNAHSWFSPWRVPR